LTRSPPLTTSVRTHAMAAKETILLVPCPQCGRDRKVPYHRRHERGRPDILCRRCSAQRNVCRTWHGDHRARLYTIWFCMRRRCGLLKSEPAKLRNYADRGITMCSQWAESYRAFREWAHANGYRDSLTIDRIDNDRGYEPENCRWATRLEQSRNTRANHLVTLEGRTQPLSAWAEERGLSYSAVFQRVKNGWTEERALSTAIAARRRAERSSLALE